MLVAENIFGASTPARGKMIYSTVTARIKSLDESFYQLFMESDVSTQKLFALAGALAHDTLFFDFVSFSRINKSKALMLKSLRKLQ